MRDGGGDQRPVVFNLLAPVPQFPIAEVPQDGIDRPAVLVLLNQPQGILLRERACRDPRIHFVPVKCEAKRQGVEYLGVSPSGSGGGGSGHASRLCFAIDVPPSKPTKKGRTGSASHGPHAKDVDGRGPVRVQWGNSCHCSSRRVFLLPAPSHRSISRLGSFNQLNNSSTSRTPGTIQPQSIH